MSLRTPSGYQAKMALPMANYETKTVSLARLEKDYYVTQSQKDEVNGYVSKLNDEADYAKRVNN